MWKKPCGLIVPGINFFIKNMFFYLVRIYKISFYNFLLLIEVDFHVYRHI